ncbi:MAG: acyl-CoA thioesterase [Ruminococcus sp.]|nr:acyl-CoA thioesterase [Ruminococcus sp.]
MHSKSYLTVRYAETDRMGIAHHSNYPVWYEVGRTDYIKGFGISYSDMEKAGVLMPLTNLTCHFKAPALYEDKILIRTWAMELRAAHIQFSYTVKKINDDGTEEELGYGTTEHGFVDSKTFRPCSLKKRLPELYEKVKATL